MYLLALLFICVDSLSTVGKNAKCPGSWFKQERSKSEMIRDNKHDREDWGNKDNKHGDDWDKKHGDRKLWIISTPLLNLHRGLYNVIAGLKARQLKKEA
jgi:hypothetical protein